MKTFRHSDIKIKKLHTKNKVRCPYCHNKFISTDIRGEFSRIYILKLTNQSKTFALDIKRELGYTISTVNKLIWDLERKELLKKEDFLTKKGKWAKLLKITKKGKSILRLIK